MTNVRKFVSKNTERFVLFVSGVIVSAVVSGLLKKMLDVILMHRIEQDDSSCIEEYRAYLDERRSLVDAEREVSERFDRWVITLSAGALGLSITFIKQIAPKPKAATVWYLGLSWIAFGIALLLMLLSLIMSQSALRKQREILDADYRELENARDAKNIPAVYTNYLNWASVVFFIVGVVLLGTFTILNLPTL
jgi:hypothetical protein